MSDCISSGICRATQLEAKNAKLREERDHQHALKDQVEQDLQTLEDQLLESQEREARLRAALEDAREALGLIDMLKEGFEEDYVERAMKLSYDGQANAMKALSSTPEPRSRTVDLENALTKAGNELRTKIEEISDIIRGILRLHDLGPGLKNLPGWGEEMDSGLNELRKLISKRDI